MVCADCPECKDKMPDYNGDREKALKTINEVQTLGEVAEFIDDLRVQYGEAWDDMLVADSDADSDKGEDIGYTPVDGSSEEEANANKPDDDSSRDGLVISKQQEVPDKRFISQFRNLNVEADHRTDRRVHFGKLEGSKGCPKYSRIFLVGSSIEEWDQLDGRVIEVLTCNASNTGERSTSFGHEVEGKTNSNDNGSAFKRDDLVIPQAAPVLPIHVTTEGDETAKFGGVCLDTGASTSFCGLEQAKAYAVFAGFKLQLNGGPRTFKFGSARSRSMGVIIVRIPVPGHSL